MMKWLLLLFGIYFSWLVIFDTWQAVIQRLLSSLVASDGQQGTGWMIKHRFALEESEYHEQMMLPDAQLV